MWQRCVCFRARDLEQSLLIFLIFALQGLERAEQSVVVASASASFKWNLQAFEAEALALEQDRDKCTRVSNDLLQVANPTLLHKILSIDNIHNEEQHSLVDVTLEKSVAASVRCPESVDACEPTMIRCEEPVKFRMKESRDEADETARAKRMLPTNQNNMWMKMFSSLVLFMQQQGHSDVPTVGKQCKDSSLGR